MIVSPELIRDLREQGNHSKVGVALTLLAHDTGSWQAFVVRHNDKPNDGVSGGEWGPVSETAQCVQAGERVLVPEQPIDTAVRALQEEVQPVDNPELWTPNGIDLPTFDWPMGPNRLPAFAIAQFLLSENPEALTQGRYSDEVGVGMWVGFRALKHLIDHGNVRSGVAKWYDIILPLLPAVLDAFQAGERSKVDFSSRLTQGQDIRFEPAAVR